MRKHLEESDVLDILFLVWTLRSIFLYDTNELGRTDNLEDKWNGSFLCPTTLKQTGLTHPSGRHFMSLLLGKEILQ